MDKDEFTISETMLSVGDGHELYVHEWGNPDSKVPVIFLHGGPGDRVKNKYKRFFNPAKQQVIFFDQRGCGKSTPYGSLENNTTDYLIDDISKIADNFNAPRFILHGSSWGSTLALAYSIKNPERVDALVIGAVFTASKKEIDWIDKGGFAKFYPDVWQKYLVNTPTEYHTNPSEYHYNKALYGSADEQKLSCYVYSNKQASLLSLDDRYTPQNYEDFDPAGMRIGMHYLANNCFMKERHILDNAHTLTMPVHIVQGRYDMVCPPETAYELAKSLPNSQLYMTINGHQHEHEAENIFRSIYASL